MASFIPSKKEATDFNNGVQYINGVDALQAETVNNLVESALFVQDEVSSAKTIADSAVDIANDAMDKIDDAISGGVSGVKGANETTYRTGQVTLTAEDIGAVVYRHSVTYINVDEDTTHRAYLSFTIYNSFTTPITNIQSLYTTIGSVTGSKICGVSGHTSVTNALPLYIYFVNSTTAKVFQINQNGQSMVSAFTLYDQYALQDQYDDVTYTNCFNDEVTKIQ